MRRGLLSLAWGSAQAGASLTLASSAWLVSGLSPSPLVNSLLPVFGTAASLLPLPQHPLLGSLVQMAATLVLVGVGLAAPVPAGLDGGGSANLWLLILALLAVLLFGLGLQIAQFPLQRYLVGHQGVSMRRLRSGSDLGALLGHLLTGLLFPIGKAVLQFSQALVLLLPLLPAALQSGQARPARAEPSAPDLALASPEQGLNWRCCLQGVLFGSLFSLLPLWVRQQGAGNCFDFGMLLTAYGLGRLLSASWPVLSLPFPGAGVGRYLLLSGLLAATQWLPGWSSLALFLPMGALAGSSDARLAASLAHLADEPLRWQTLERSSAVGALVGSLVMGSLAQWLGLPLALPLQVVAFLAAALPLAIRGAARPAS
ncbi:hypothetical protein KQ306_11710 [Synechococcus sp. CS-1324]|uniref:hypothetical protein n=1 Tax=Synechococcus sp. CS-1324 TaxID=2847980 RepID=UPI000DB1F693|nr:hypothetical protein [Synechococcus sp. CS-1324]MCT0231512.1 hypothetical protein [Synechococcus sp. CS-1324]PZV05516.1 MAG: hypothetical protein DCF23_02475 [Cyanobium sp.]